MRTKLLAAAIVLILLSAVAVHWAMRPMRVAWQFQHLLETRQVDEARKLLANGYTLNRQPYYKDGRFDVCFRDPGTGEFKQMRVIVPDDGSSQVVFLSWTFDDFMARRRGFLIQDQVNMVPFVVQGGKVKWE